MLCLVKQGGHNEFCLKFHQIANKKSNASSASCSCTDMACTMDQCIGEPQMCHNTSWNIIECRYYLESSNLHVLPTGAFLYLSLKIALNALNLCTLQRLLFASNHEPVHQEGKICAFICLLINVFCVTYPGAVLRR